MPSFTTRASDEDENRIAAQDTQIKQLEARIDVLEIKVGALQEVNGYQAALGRRPISRNPQASPQVKSGE